VTAASFEDSWVPMLVADDRRCFVGVNRAMCLLLRSDRAAVLQMRVDDLTPPELRGDLEELWEAFVREGVQNGTFELLMPDGPRLRVDYSATANVEPGRHLSLFVVAATEGEVLPGRADRRRLSVREREVLALVAMGERGARIAQVLGIAQGTVESHVRSCLAKLEAKNRAHAIALALHRGEISMDLGPAKP
jgi:DNA-binding CsgD family transcriptional regulator